MTELNDLVAWYRAQLDDDERWARAANQAYTYAEDKTPPEAGVHWTWVSGDNWDVVTPDPVLDEFVGGYEGWRVNLATVEEWPSRITPTSAPSMMRRTYAGTIEEMDPSAAGHIVRWDPARVLAEIDAKRRILAECERMLLRDRLRPGDYWDGCRDALRSTVIALALPYADRPGYREEWRP